ncbi:MAG: hypothetical protein IIA88_01040 [Bacteroidetes bacterium]|nr:hypothetical protein [Bacteroidota bacterium]
METVISLKFKDSLKKGLEKKAKELKLNTNDLIIKALENFIYFEKVNNLRRELNKYATKKGFKGEEDVFREIS